METKRKARPILMSAPMVNAALESRKTQTRRAMKNPDDGVTTSINHGDGWAEAWARYEQTGSQWMRRNSPYGKPGDLLWVRETFARNGLQDGERVFYRANAESQFMGEMRESNGNITRYHTDYWERNGERRKGSDWKPSIFMPRWVSRLTLEVTNIRIEHLSDISDADAIAEGLACITKDGGQTLKYGIPDRDGLPGDDNQGWPWSDWNTSPRHAYFKLWEKINGRESLLLNPWVWVIDFKVHKKNVDEVLRES